jgi:aldehyde dehydrogenase (NAD+)
MAVKIAAALAMGCTMVLKPSEIAPFSATLLAEIIDAAGVPPGVFNLIHGDGPGVGAALARHQDVDMISFTGSTRAGVDVAINAAPTVKRVCQELGGKSPNIILDDASFLRNVKSGVSYAMVNSGQTCSAPTRMLLPRARLPEAIEAARDVAASITVGDPAGTFDIGPVASRAQFDKVQALIQVGIDEGAELIAGGLGRPIDLERGYFVRPTVFAGVTSTMRIAREEIFGPVLAMLAYDDIDHAVAMANDTEYGLSGYVVGEDIAAVRAVSRRLRAGRIVMNGAFDPRAPFGGYKRSGNGRECGLAGFHEYLELKSLVGYAATIPKQA